MLIKNEKAFNACAYDEQAPTYSYDQTVYIVITISSLNCYPFFPIDYIRNLLGWFLSIQAHFSW